MVELKRLSKDAVPGALAKAERYRLLNEPEMAESICLDILAVEPDHQVAMTTLILAITDQFGQEGAGRHTARAQALIPRLEDAYARVYYSGIISERRARAIVSSGPASLARDWLLDALRGFERAIALRPAGNDDAILRWNACARTLDRLPAAPQGPGDTADTAIMSE
jgi:hypothetical protein